MPGILPMKVIKVGTSAQSRIAQACDRCRSKKIRCDGITPCCSQCSNVGFECKTSDKLSRRAFPRGYTESLEERVRALETEVKELKDLLDGKDEKIDILSRVHPYSASPNSPPRIRSTATGEAKPVVQKEDPKEDVFKVQQSPCLLQQENQDSFFMGASSGRTFVDAFKTKAQESGKPYTDMKVEMFFAMNRKSAVSQKAASATISKEPPRLVSDQMITIFFQEWAPLFPILHQPSFLDLYNKYVDSPKSLTSQQSIAQLNLVFGIAALSAEWNHQSSTEFETRWQTALGSILHDSSLATLQCLVLAQIYCISKGEYGKLLHYKGIAISLSHRLGLHQSQKRFSLSVLTSETRKRTFWTQYTLDCFSAAILGLPKLMNETDIHAEYPADIDDQNISQNGFQSTLPGESTRISSALALFRVSRIMSKVLDEVYPAASSHELSLGKISTLNDELGIWLQSLGSHHRLQFVQDKPSTNVIGSRSPFLSLAYHYIRTLIHRPAVGSSLGAKASSSVMAVASSSKHIVQILQLLEERRMSFSFCLNKNQLLLLSGFGLLFQGVELNRKGKLIQDSQRLMCSIIEILERSDAPGAEDLKKLACGMINIDKTTRAARLSGSEAISRRKSEGAMSAPQGDGKSTRKQLQAIASCFSYGTGRGMKQRVQDSPRSAASGLVIANPILYARSDSQKSASSAVSDPAIQYGYPQAINQHASPCQIGQLETPNFDYLSFNNNSHPGSYVPAALPVHQPNKLNIERLTSYVATQHSQLSCDGHFPSTEMLSAYVSSSPSSAGYEWSSDVWTLSSDLSHNPASAQSVLSFSEDEVASGEELGNCKIEQNFREIMMPNVDGYSGLDGYDGFGL